MKVNRSSGSNLRFLYGSVFFFAVLILTMVLFIYYAMSEASKKVESKMFAYTISLDGADDVDCAVVFDDSLVYDSGSAALVKPVVVNRRIKRDTIVSGGERIIREKTLFSSESCLRVINRTSGDTLSVVAGDNSVINVLFKDGKASVELLK